MGCLEEKLRDALHEDGRRCLEQLLNDPDLCSTDILANAKPSNRQGVGVIEAPRGTLYHKVVIDKDGIVENGEVIVPTGQNQVNIERDVGTLVEELLPDAPKEKINFEIEKLIRAYDPCMSCGAHFLKVKWQER